MIVPFVHLLLADNDPDDRMIFGEALDEIAFNGSFTAVNDGEQLMEFLLAQLNKLPDLLFLDLNMPRKNGFECLAEISRHEELKHLPVVIYSTSFEPQTVKKLRNHGAKFYIQKPAEFTRLKEVIKKAINLSVKPYPQTSGSGEFILYP